MVGFTIAFWVTPTVTVGHLLFAVCTTGYIVVAAHPEERDLAGALGAPYRENRLQVALFLPYPMRQKATTVLRGALTKRGPHG
jgi:protein-S-isoprenylcysteine O-methyltransferase Ste14